MIPKTPWIVRTYSRPNFFNHAAGFRNLIAKAHPSKAIRSRTTRTPSHSLGAQLQPVTSKYTPQMYQNVGQQPEREWPTVPAIVWSVSLCAPVNLLHINQGEDVPAWDQAGAINAPCEKSTKCQHVRRPGTPALPYVKATAGDLSVLCWTLGTGMFTICSSLKQTLATVEPPWHFKGLVRSLNLSFQQ